MALKALVTLDLDKVSSTQRKDFYQYLENAHLVKIPNIDTAWKCVFAKETNRADAITTCKKIINDAAKKTGISFMASAIQIGDGEVVEF